MGSEMCIRDRPYAHRSQSHRPFTTLVLASCWYGYMSKGWSVGRATARVEYSLLFLLRATEHSMDLSLAWYVFLGIGASCILAVLWACYQMGLEDALARMPHRDDWWWVAELARYRARDEASASENQQKAGLASERSKLAEEGHFG